MASRELQHIESVMRALEHAQTDVIHTSWQRCVGTYRLDPTRSQETVILPGPRIREHQSELGETLSIARAAAERLHAQVADLGYVVLVADAQGVTVDFHGDHAATGRLRRAGLWLGSHWSEAAAGTNGIGTTLATGRPLTVHQGEHFDAAHIRLSCTTAPVFDSRGDMAVVFDVSALSSPGPRDSQNGVLELVKACAIDFETAAFFAHHRADWIVRLGRSPHFLDVRPELLVAVDEGGVIRGYNEAAARALADGDRKAMLGVPITRVFGAMGEDLGRLIDRPARLGDLHARASAPARPLPSPPRRPSPMPPPLARLSGGDAALDAQLARAARLFGSRVTFLVTGETGTGKEWFARAVHESSPRAGRPFVAVNCAAIPESLFESELFGHQPGSFSGASPRGKLGLVRSADRGTLLLDEVGELSLPMQASLLRVLAEREVLPVGATRPIAVDAQIIVATHRDLPDLVRRGLFREDLYYRLEGASFTMPPLRDRDDLDWLVDRVLATVAEERGRKTVATLTDEAREALLGWSWPGNLRELHNVLASASSLAEGPITLADLPDRLRSREIDAPIAEDDAAEMARALRTAGNVAAAARMLGVSRMTMYRRMKRLGLSVTRVTART